MTAVGVLLFSAALLVLPGPPVRLPSLRGGGQGREFGGRPRVVVICALGASTAIAVAVLAGGHVLCATVILAGTVWTRRRSARRRRAHRAEVDSLIAGLDTVVGELRVGAHPAAACSAAAAECTGSVATALGGAAGRARLGGTPHEGLRVPDSQVTTELNIVAAAWRVADQHGLALVGLLAAARGDMIARNRFRDRTEASLAGARATGTVLACLPLVGVGLGQAMGAAPVSVLLSGGLGGILLVVGSSLVCAGLLWTDAITGKVCR